MGCDTSRMPRTGLGVPTTKFLHRRSWCKSIFLIRKTLFFRTLNLKKIAANRPRRERAAPRTGLRALEVACPGGCVPNQLACQPSLRPRHCLRTRTEPNPETHTTAPPPLPIITSGCHQDKNVSHRTCTHRSATAYPSGQVFTRRRPPKNCFHFRGEAAHSSGQAFPCRRPPATCCDFRGTPACNPLRAPVFSYRSVQVK